MTDIQDSVQIAPQVQACEAPQPIKRGRGRPRKDNNAPIDPPKSKKTPEQIAKEYEENKEKSRQRILKQYHEDPEYRLRVIERSKAYARAARDALRAFKALQITQKTE